MRRVIVKFRVLEEENFIFKMIIGWLYLILYYYLFLYIRFKMNVSKYVLKIVNGVIILNVF